MHNSAGAAIPFCAAIPFDAAGCTAGGNVGEFLVPLGVQLSPSVEDFRGGGRKKSLSMPHEAVMRNVAQFARETLERRPSRVGTRPVERWNAAGASPVLRLRLVFCAAAEGALS